MEKNSVKKKYSLRFSTACILFGLTAAYIAFSYAMYISRIQYWEQEDFKQLTAASSKLTLYLGYHEGEEEVYRLLTGEGIEASICDADIYVDALEGQCLCDVFFSTPSESKYHFVEGGYPQEASPKPAVVLGRRRKKYVHTVDGVDYITICHEEYEVTGYISAEHSGIYDYKILLFWNSMGEEARESIRYTASQTWGLYVQLQSSREDVGKFYSQRLKSLEAACDFVMPMEEPVTGYDTDLPSINYRKYSVLLYVFSVVIMVMSIEFWIYERREELIVRRITGYDRWQLLGLVGRRLFSLMLPYSILLLLVQTLICLINGQGADWQFYLVQIGLSLGFIAATFVILMLYPMYEIMRGDIIKNLGRSKRIK